MRPRRVALRPILAGLAALLMLAWAASAPSAAEGASRVHALRLAGIAERIAKLHAQAGGDVLAERSRRSLAEAIRDFDATLRAAAARPGSAESRDNYLLLGLLWREYRPWALRPPTRDSIRKVADRGEEVAWIAAKAPRIAPAAGPLALDAARACALSQRVPRLHFMRHWEPRNDALARELAAASEELAAILARLAAAGQNSDDIAAHLQIAQTQHGFLVSSGAEMHRPGAHPRHAQNVAKTGDHILEALERALRLYDEARL